MSLYLLLYLYFFKSYFHLCIYPSEPIFLPISLSVYINIDMERQSSLVFKSTDVGSKQLRMNPIPPNIVTLWADYLVFTYLNLFSRKMG